jgi:hypothetical protein
MSQNPGIETVAEFLARGGRIQKIQTGQSGDPELKFNHKLRDRIKRQKEKTWEVARKRLHKQDIGG